MRGYDKSRKWPATVAFFAATVVPAIATKILAGTGSKSYNGTKEAARSVPLFDIVNQDFPNLAITCRKVTPVAMAWAGQRSSVHPADVAASCGALATGKRAL